RALAAVDETRRKRMERQQVEHRGDEEKLRRRQAKREQLMKKRKDMEERLEEEAVKMAELTESAKKKGESKFMSEEAKREAEERIRAEAEVVAQLERQAADMALQRENMQKQLAEREDIKAAEIEANTSALKTKRALVEARMRQEEEEIKTLSEAAKREATVCCFAHLPQQVEAKMVAEAAAIAEMERQALQLSTKRAELQAEMTNKRELDDTLVQEAQLIARKREAFEAKMQREEEELQKLSDEAKQRVLEKMAAEAAAIAGMEREASKLAEERAILESQIAEQRSSNAAEGTSAVPTNTQDDNKGQVGHVDPVDTQGIPLTTTSGRDEACAPVPTVSENAEETTDVTERAAPQSASPDMRKDQGEPGLVENLTLTSSAESPEVLRYTETTDDGLALAGSVQEGGSHWNGHQDFPPADSIDSGVCAHCRTHQREMSTAHLAAAAGHLTCLEAIQSTQREMLAEVDSSGRSPLFYACANAHADAADLLIQESPQSCHAMDVNRDTPLHAAALAGSRLCCRLLLQHGRSAVEPLNEMEMTPAHLAANNDVLEVLSQHGANLNAKDADLRTPLFVACASDRLEKAEFLCELLEYADQDLGEVDKRGDTPMHAAAYNGSTACLLLLLQYGVEPDARNTKGLRPIDLASRRGQSACEKILMEYQLHHHVNNSYFDSVLFLATLEGHKRCRETLNSVKQQGDTTVGAQEDSALVRPQSLMSLRRERSVRLEHWGDWISYEDQNEKSVFWYNHVEEKSQRDAPTGVREGSASSLTKASMRLKREGDWIEYTLPDGNVFYYNDKNNEFQWERPDDLSSTAVAQEWADEDERLEGDTGIGGSTGDWMAFKDPSTGLVFWYNQVTDESQWEPPEEDREVGDRRADTESRADGNSMVPEDNVREIDSVDDLFTPR
ncbi:unnamed protein product, partial [Ectocarpus sp. 8 AP-2014]